MSTQSQAAKWAAMIGGGLGVGIVLSVWIGQLNLGEVLSGRMPLRVAIALNSNAFIILSVLLLVFLFGTAIALWQKFPLVWAGVIWLGIGSILAYIVYISRFSIGPLLIPSSILFTIAGGLAIWQRR